jgi:hypothetical protein
MNTDSETFVVGLSSEDFAVTAWNLSQVAVLLSESVGGFLAPDSLELLAS